MFSKRMGLVRILNSNINNGTMSSIIHQPPGSCSSCGN